METDFKTIYSGKNKLQILHKGYRFGVSKVPDLSTPVCYFRCVVKKCKSRCGGRIGSDGVLGIKQLGETHNHPPDEAGNIVAATMYEYREKVRSNPLYSVKQIYEDVINNVLTSPEAAGIPDLAERFSSFRNGNRIFECVLE